LIYADTYPVANKAIDLLPELAESARMNFLAHLFLSPPGDEALLGSLMGDFVKGPLDAKLPAYRHGLILHRKIDSFTDAHAMVRRSRNRISSARRRYAGIMVDMFYDHFLANNWAGYCREPLESFTARVYALLERNSEVLPERLRRIAPQMARQDWLSSYREVESIHIALNRTGDRLKRGNALLGAAHELTANYDGLRDDFRAFFPDVIAFAQRLAAQSERERS